MPHSRGRLTFVACALTLGVFLAIAGSAFASSRHRVVEMKDDCDPATFNAMFGPGTCVGEGETLVQDFLAEFAAKGSVDGWEFDPERLKAKRGGTVTAVDEGGEVHTFTEVKRFGGGCVAGLNTFEPTPATPIGDSLCALFFAGTEPSAVAPGMSFTTAPLAPGTHRYECLIHPWMRTTVKVRHRGHGRGHDDDDD